MSTYILDYLLLLSECLYDDILGLVLPSTGEEVGLSTKEAKKCPKQLQTLEIQDAKQINILQVRSNAL